MVISDKNIDLKTILSSLVSQNAFLPIFTRIDDDQPAALLTKFSDGVQYNTAYAQEASSLLRPGIMMSSPSLQAKDGKATDTSQKYHFRRRDVCHHDFPRILEMVVCYDTERLT